MLDHQKKIRPLDALCQLLNPMTKISVNSIPLTLVPEFKQFSLALTTLRKLASTDARTTGYNYDDVARDERDKAKEELRHVREKFNKDTLQHERQLAEMERELRLLHVEIMEFNRENSVLQEKKLVKEQEIYQQISSEAEEEKLERHSQNCCYKYILCCFTTGSSTRTNQSIAKLKEQQKKLLSSDPTETNIITIAGLTAKRDQLYRQLQELMKHPPELNDEAISIRLGQANARIEDGETRYYTEVTTKLMFQLVRIDALYKLLARKLAEYSINNRNAPFILSVRKLFDDNADKINDLINQFWCATPEIHDASYFKDIFNKLSDAEQTEILSKGIITTELVNMIIPLRQTDVCLRT